MTAIFSVRSGGHPAWVLRTKPWDVTVFDSPQAFSNFMAPLLREHDADGHAADGTLMKHGLCMRAIATALVWGSSRKPESIPRRDPSVIAALASLSRAIGLPLHQWRWATGAGIVGLLVGYFFRGRRRG